jgi:hypothetical protein
LRGRSNQSGQVPIGACLFFCKKKLQKLLY